MQGVIDNAFNLYMHQRFGRLSVIDYTGAPGEPAQMNYKSANALAAARRHFGCPDMESLQMEIGAFTAHLSSRTFSVRPPPIAVAAVDCMPWTYCNADPQFRLLAGGPLAVPPLECALSDGPPEVSPEAALHPTRGRMHGARPR